MFGSAFCPLGAQPHHGAGVRTSHAREEDVMDHPDYPAAPTTMVPTSPQDLVQHLRVLGKGILVFESIQGEMGLGFVAAVTADAILGEDRPQILRERILRLLFAGIFVFRLRNLRPKPAGQETENRNMPTDHHRGFLVDLNKTEQGEPTCRL